MEESDHGDDGGAVASSREVAAAPRRSGVSGERLGLLPQSPVACVELLISCVLLLLLVVRISEF